MRDQGVVTGPEAGVNKYYSIADDRIVEAMETMREVLLEQLADNAAVSEHND